MGVRIPSLIKPRAEGIMTIGGEVIAAHDHQHPVSPIRSIIPVGEGLPRQGAKLGIQRIELQGVDAFQHAADLGLLEVLDRGQFQFEALLLIIGRRVRIHLWLSLQLHRGPYLHLWANLRLRLMFYVRLRSLLCIYAHVDPFH
jgi:hypothetical protein